MPAPNPLFLRDEALDQALELLFLAEATLQATARAPLARRGLALVEYRLLYLIARRPGTTLAELQALTGIAKQSLSRLAKDLAAAGLVAQRTTEQDRRKRLLEATPPAMQHLAEIAQVQRRMLRKAFTAAGPEAVEGFRRLLSELVEEPQRRPARRLASAAAP